MIEWIKPVETQIVFGLLVATILIFLSIPRLAHERSMRSLAEHRDTIKEQDEKLARAADKQKEYEARIARLEDEVRQRRELVEAMVIERRAAERYAERIDRYADRLEGLLERAAIAFPERPERPG